MHEQGSIKGKERIKTCRDVIIGYLPNILIKHYSSIWIVLYASLGSHTSSYAF
ncbi:hypothetical protein M085_4470, partial [Bacteroides fragilis str. 3986 N(B)19]